MTDQTEAAAEEIERRYERRKAKAAALINDAYYAWLRAWWSNQPRSPAFMDAFKAGWEAADLNAGRTQSPRSESEK